MRFHHSNAAPPLLGLLILLASGCAKDRPHVLPDPPAPLGAISDDIWRKHEENAEASDFVIRDHEFTGNTARLNNRGEDHVKQIAVRAAGVPFPIAIEPSSMSIKEGTVYEFPIHNNHELDMARRRVIVGALTEMGVRDAEQRVVVAPPFTPGFEWFEAQNAYESTFSGQGGGAAGGFGGAGFGGTSVGGRF